MGGFRIFAGAGQTHCEPVSTVAVPDLLYAQNEE
jgi:hypothetical protein